MLKCVQDNGTVFWLSFLQRTEWENIPVREVNVAGVYNIGACCLWALKLSKRSAKSLGASSFLKNSDISLSGAFSSQRRGYL